MFFLLCVFGGVTLKGCYTNVIFGLLRVSSLHRIASLLIEYVISMPNMYARGILWGKMVLELGDSCTARNENNGFFSEMQFKTKVRVVVLL